jgi:cellulose synthase/poly-beta-1,6-N-acetylglucosamine synthase-like glycosyltransferase
MLLVVEILFALSAVISSLYFVFVYLGWRRAVHAAPGPASEEDVTIIVAAHNEEKRLPALLTALREQHAPTLRLRILIMDDRSTDDTRELIENYNGTLDMQLLHIDSVPEGVSPKKHALHEGIGAAETDCILLTDADCVPEPDWAASMARVLAKGNDVVLGLAPLTSTRTSAARYAAFESRRTMALMTAAAAWGLPYMASGRSWGFRKSVYQSAGGLEPLFHHLGGDDDLLLQQFVRSRARIGICTERGSLVHSATPLDWESLRRQKLRHYRVSSAYRGRAAFLLGVFVASETLVPLSAIALSLLLPGWQKLVPAALWAWKLWYDSGFLVAPAKWMKGDHTRFGLAKWEGFHIFHAAIIGLLSYLKPPKW